MNNSDWLHPGDRVQLSGKIAGCLSHSNAVRPNYNCERSGEWMKRQTYTRGIPEVDPSSCGYAELIERVAKEMNNYTQTRDRLASKCVEHLFPAYTVAVQQGEWDIEVVWKRCGMDDFLREKMQENWNDVVGSDPYYHNGVTDEDRDFIFRNLKSGVYHAMLPLLYKRLSENLEAAISDYAVLVRKAHDTIGQLQNQLDAVRLFEARRLLDDALERSFFVEKFRMFLIGRGVTVREQFGEKIEPPTVIASLASVPNNPPMIQEEQLHVFERKLKGGYVSSVPGGAYIRELIRRQNGWMDGDLLRVVSVDDKLSPPKYEFELVKRVNREQPNRIEIINAEVKMDPGYFYVDQYDPEGEGNWREIRINDQPERIRIKDEDVEEMRIRIGDRIDLAYYKENPRTVRVVWVYLKLKGGRP